jgi:hypothetical protein
MVFRALEPAKIDPGESAPTCPSFHQERLYIQWSLGVLSWNTVFLDFEPDVFGSMHCKRVSIRLSALQSFWYCFIVDWVSIGSQDIAREKQLRQSMTMSAGRRFSGLCFKVENSLQSWSSEPSPFNLAYKKKVRWCRNWKIFRSRCGSARWTWSILATNLTPLPRNIPPWTTITS